MCNCASLWNARVYPDEPPHSLFDLLDIFSVSDQVEIKRADSPLHETVVPFGNECDLMYRICYVVDTWILEDLVHTEVYVVPA